MLAAKSWEEACAIRERVDGKRMSKQINSAIAKLDDGKWVKFMDIGDKFLEPDGTLSKDIMPDLLHPNKKGYRIWADAIQSTLESMMK